MRHSILIIVGGIGLSVAMTSCNKSRGNDPGVEYAPDMYYSKGYEPYSQTDSNRINPYGINMRTPVQGTVAIGQIDYQYPYDNTPEGYEAAGMGLVMPAMTIVQQQEGERLYGIYCKVCHGEKGISDATATVSSKQSAVQPAWKNYQSATIKALPVGKMYHTVTYGKNNMGSYASALSPEERWWVISYVKRLSQMDSATGVIPPAVAIQKTAAHNDTLSSVPTIKIIIPHEISDEMPPPALDELKPGRANHHQQGEGSSPANH